MYLTQGLNKDCVVISLANYTGRTYEQVMAAVNTIGYTKEYVWKTGTPVFIIPAVIALLTGKLPRTLRPRKGQTKLNGIADFHSPSAKNGHCAPVIDGIVYDTDGSVTSIEEYKLDKGYVLRNFWIC